MYLNSLRQRKLELEQDISWWQEVVSEFICPIFDGEEVADYEERYYRRKIDKARVELNEINAILEGFNK